MKFGEGRGDSREFSLQGSDPCKISLNCKLGIATACSVRRDICGSRFFFFFFPFFHFLFFFFLPFFSPRLCSHPLSQFPYVKTASKGHATRTPGGDGSIPVGAECFGEEPTHPRSFSPEQGFVVRVCACFSTALSIQALFFPTRHYGLWMNKHKDIQATFKKKKKETNPLPYPIS